MFKLFSIVEEKESPINGKIQIVRDLQGARIIVGGVSQSGWLVKSIWNKALKKVTSNKRQETSKTEKKEGGLRRNWCKNTGLGLK